MAILPTNRAAILRKVETARLAGRNEEYARLRAMAFNGHDDDLDDDPAQAPDEPDLHPSEPPPRAKVEPAPDPPGDPDWQLRLARTTRGPKPHLSNVVTALTHAPEWAGVLGWDEFAHAIAVRKAPPFARPGGAWSDVDDAKTAVWMQDHGLDVTPDVVARAVAVVADATRFHPVREWLGGLRWDGTPRLDTWLRRYLGVRDNALTREIARRFLIGAVARIFRPGCQNDHALILEGAQGSSKSTAIKILFDPWFTDEVADIGSRDAAMGLRGVWGVELSELDALGKKESTAIKAWITRRVDRYRPPYGRREIEVARQCVFLGTTNKDDYLRDATGNRRFWTVKTHPVRDGLLDVAGLGEAREQLWAEAVALFLRGEPWHITDPQLVEEMRAEQAERQEEDPWESAVMAYVSDLEFTTVPAIAAHLQLTTAQQDKRAAMRIADILKRNGWAKQPRRREGAGRVWPWEPQR
jgi:predicted P-loop ATPase